MQTGLRKAMALIGAAMLAIALYYVIHAESVAQTSSGEISLDSPVSFPVDI